MNKKEKSAFRLFISFFEVYNERIYDLFSLKELKDGLEIRENKNGDV